MKNPRKPLPRSRTPLARTPAKKVNAKRKAREFARAYGSKERVEWLHTQPCALLTQAHLGPIQAAHVMGGGMGRKSDADHIVPLCMAHHALLHTQGATWFQREFGVNLEALAEITELRWRAHSGTGEDRDA